jgi:phenylalanyl-tRNA synthetase beta chain
MGFIIIEGIMRLSVEWIKEFVPTDASSEELARTLTMAGLEVEETIESEIGPVLDITVTPNRGDCLSVIGVARELNAVYSLQFPSIPNGVSVQPVKADCEISVAIEDIDLCSRYVARLVTNVRSKPSPEWMQKRLVAAGMRPINGIVDVTNYVMLETGQPLHAFDYDKLHGGRIVVRRARKGETIRTLDGVDRVLTEEMLAICDADHPVAIAGVMGGEEAEMNDSTKIMLLESAHFLPVSIRRTSKKLNLRTEASYRFERYVDPESVAKAADRACQLIAECGLGDVTTVLCDEYPVKLAPKRIVFRLARANAMLGYDIPKPEMIKALANLGFESLEEQEGHITYSVPSWRPDIQREIDIIEEVGRIIGYDRIPERLPVGVTTQGGDTPIGKMTAKIRTGIAAVGLQEVITHSLLAPGKLENDDPDGQRIEIRSALSSDLSGLRRSLLPGLLEAADRNARRGQFPLAFFEIGKVFHRTHKGYEESLVVGGIMAGAIAPRSWVRDDKRPEADFYMAKGIAEIVSHLCSVSDLQFCVCDDVRLHPGRSANIMLSGKRIGVVGELHPELRKLHSIREKICFFEMDLERLMDAETKKQVFVSLSSYPVVVRDIAPRVANSVTYEKVLSSVKEVMPEILEKIELTDVFTGSQVGEEMKSLTLSLTFRSPERTLTDSEVNEALEKIRANLMERCNARFVG